MKAHNGSTPRARWKSPPGYVSAKAKAYAAWKADAKINHVDYETDDDSSEDEGFSIAAVRTSRVNAVAPAPEPVATSNSFKDLAEFNDDEHDEDAVAALGSWAHKVVVGEK